MTCPNHRLGQRCPGLCDHCVIPCACQRETGAHHTATFVALRKQQYPRPSCKAQPPSEQSLVASLVIRRCGACVGTRLVDSSCADESKPAIVTPHCRQSAALCRSHDSCFHFVRVFLMRFAQVGRHHRRRVLRRSRHRRRYATGPKVSRCLFIHEQHLCGACMGIMCAGRSRSDMHVFSVLLLGRDMCWQVLAGSHTPRCKTHILGRLSLSCHASQSSS